MGAVESVLGCLGREEAALSSRSWLDRCRLIELVLSSLDKQVGSVFLVRFGLAGVLLSMADRTRVWLWGRKMGYSCFGGDGVEGRETLVDTEPRGSLPSAISNDQQCAVENNGEDGEVTVDKGKGKWWVDETDATFITSTFV